MKIFIYLFLALLLILLVRLFIYDNFEKFKKAESVDFNHTLLDNPKETYYGQQVRIRDLFVNVPTSPKLFYADTIRVKGVVEERIISGSRGERKILVLEVSKIEKQKSVNFFLPLLGAIRTKVEKSFSKSLSTNYSGLLIGIILGIKQVFTDDFSQGLSRTGLLHVVAASGMNVSIVGGFLLTVFLKFFKRQNALIITIIFIFLYALLAGFQASIVRAAIMASIAYGALIFGRQNYALLSLFLTSLVMLLISPFTLFDVGFQLSFAATLGIITIKPFLDLLFDFKKLFFLEDFPTTISAQITTFPIIMSTFGNYSPVSIVTNILLLWTIPILMIFGGIGAIASLISPVLAAPFLYLCFPFLLFFEKIILFFSKNSFMVNIETFPAALTIGYYIILLALILKLKKHA